MIHPFWFRIVPSGVDATKFSRAVGSLATRLIQPKHEVSTAIVKAPNRSELALAIRLDTKHKVFRLILGDYSRIDVPYKWFNKQSRSFTCKDTITIQDCGQTIAWLESPWAKSDPVWSCSTAALLFDFDPRFRIQYVLRSSAFPRNKIGSVAVALKKLDLRWLDSLRLPNVLDRIYHAWRAGTPGLLIAHAAVHGRSLDVLSCDFKIWTKSFSSIPWMRREERRLFEVEERDGSYIHWPSSDTHLSLSFFKS